MPPGRRNPWPVSGDAFLAAWPAQTTASFGGHIFGGLAGATYGQSRGHIFAGLAGATYGWAPGTYSWWLGRRNLWPGSGDSFLVAWPAQRIAGCGEYIFGSLTGALWLVLGNTFLAALLAQPMASLGGTLLAAWMLDGATYGWHTCLCGVRGCAGTSQRRPLHSPSFCL